MTRFSTIPAATMLAAHLSGLLLPAVAQDARTSAQARGARLQMRGAFAAFGKQENSGYGVYRPTSAGVEYLWSFRRYGRAGQPGRVVAYAVAEPLISVVRTTARPADWEGGATAGVRTLWQLGPRGGTFLYGCITSGPFYYSADVERQAPGFLFSDNFGLGLYTSLGHRGAASPLHLNTQLRWRHLSNASTRLPNWGINTIHVLVGLSRPRGRRTVAS